MSKASKNPVVVGIGDVVFDIFPDSRKLGGAPVDFLKYAIKNGAEGHLISAIGADDLGREVVTELKKAKINPVLAITPYPTGRVLIFNSPEKGYTAHILENAAWDYIPFTTAAENCIKTADAVYFDTLSMRNPYSRETILDLIDNAPKKAYRFFDINLRQSYYSCDIISDLIKRANILKMNTDELKELKKIFNLTGNTEEMCFKILENNKLEYLILTNGSKENMVFGKKGKITVMKNENLQQSFAYGAGNAFSGAFIASILNGASQQQAHETANETAVLLCKAVKAAKK